MCLAPTSGRRIPQSLRTFSQCAHIERRECPAARGKSESGLGHIDCSWKMKKEFRMLLTLASPRRRSDLMARARAEFLEMPGLSLTLAQASRLCGAPPEDCQRVLDELIGDGLLRRNGD